MLEETTLTHILILESGAELRVTGVPGFRDPTDPAFTAYGPATARRLDPVLRDFAAQAAPGERRSLDFASLPDSPTPPPDPVSAELSRVIRESGRSKVDVARLLGVKPPQVTQWTNPDYHQHGMETLRRVADALGLEVEVKFKPKRAG